jgi:hypothetical protein
VSTSAVVKFSESEGGFRRQFIGAGLLSAEGVTLALPWPESLARRGPQNGSPMRAIRNLFVFDP